MNFWQRQDWPKPLKNCFYTNMTFKSKVDLFYLIIVVITILLLISVSIYTLIRCTDGFSILYTFIISTLVGTLLLWLLFNTKYTIQNKVLKYRSGPFFGQIKIDEIRELQLNTKSFVGFKPALACNGIIVKYNKWNEIYISPKEVERFVIELTKVNPKIITTSNKL